MPPCRTRQVLPPVAQVGEVYRPAGHVEHERSRDKQVGMGIRVLGRIQGAFGDGDVAGLAHEAGELLYGHGMLVHPEPVDRHLMNGALLRVEVVRTHQEPSPRAPSHAVDKPAPPGPCLRPRTIDHVLIIPKLILHTPTSTGPSPRPVLPELRGLADDSRGCTTSEMDSLR